MQRRVLLGAGVAVVALAAFLLLKAGSNHVATKAVEKNIDQIVAALPPGYTATHGATETNALTGTVTLHDFKLNYGGQLLCSADQLSISGADEHALGDVFDPGAYPNGHPAWTDRRLLVADASASGVRIPAQGGRESAFIKSITLHQLSGRPFMLPPTRDHLSGRAFKADVALAFAFQSFEQHDLVATDAPPKSSKAKLADVSVRNYDGGKIGAASLRDLSLDIDTGQPGQAITHATLDSIDIKTVDAVSVLQQMRDTGADAKTFAANMSYGSAEASGLNIDISPGPRLSLKDMLFAFPPAETSGQRSGKGTLTGLTAALKDTRLPPDAAAAIEAFGMNAVTADITVKSHGNEATKTTNVTEDIVLHNLGTLHVEADISGYDQGAAQQDPNAMLQATILNHAVVSLQDSGLVDRIFNAVASRMNTTASVVRAQAAIPLVTLGMMIPDQPDAADQISAFLNHPGTLSVTMNPPEKTTLADITRAPVQSKAHVMGVHIQAK